MKQAPEVVERGGAARRHSPQDRADRAFVKDAVRRVYLQAPHDNTLAEQFREQTIERILARRR